MIHSHKPPYPMTTRKELSDLIDQHRNIKYLETGKDSEVINDILCELNGMDGLNQICSNLYIEQFLQESLQLILKGEGAE